MTPRRGEVWSLDLIIAVLVFLLAVGIFYFFTQGHAEKGQTRLRVQAQIVTDKLAASDSPDAALLDQDRIQALASQSATDYPATKQSLGLRDDFCVILIDKDGNLLLIGNGTDNYVGFGNGNLTLNLTDKNRVVACGERFA